MSKPNKHSSETWDKMLNLVYSTGEQLDGAELDAELASAGLSIDRMKDVRKKLQSQQMTHDVYPHTSSDITWTNKSICRLAPQSNPIQVLMDKIRAAILAAIDEGWYGPPFDPLALAKYLKLDLSPNSDIDDARIVPAGSSQLRIEYNPNRPASRVRYSVAHEIAHYFFPDCVEAIRNRSKKAEMTGDEWQLEMLCNLGAAEILMPIGTFPELREDVMNVDKLLELRRHYHVSTEAIFLRAVRMTGVPCLIFTASRPENDTTGVYQVDYSYKSRTWGNAPVPRTFDPKSAVAECTAIGFTAKQHIQLPGRSTSGNLECVGIPPYPKQIFPRVVGLLKAGSKPSNVGWSITFVQGDATKPRGSNVRIVAHVVNDKTSNWGAGFARAVRRVWPKVQQDFMSWTSVDPSRLALGKAHLSSVNHDLYVYHMIAQHGYGKTHGPGIRYGSLKQCLFELAAIAEKMNASVHMPRIGCGEAGGKWEVVEELINDSMGRKGISVTVYDLPDRSVSAQSVSQPQLFE